MSKDKKSCICPKCVERDDFAYMAYEDETGLYVCEECGYEKKKGGEE
jgi:Zn ribbon nucleic-acid-binding protein